MIIKNSYFEQVKELIGCNANLKEEDFILLYESLEGNEQINAGALADKLIKDLFGQMYGTTSVPWEFLQTEVGKAIIKAKFEYGNDLLFANEAAKIVGCSRQYILRECNHGNIKGEKREGTWTIREKQLNEYLVKKGKPSLYHRNIKYKLEDENVISNDFDESNYKVDKN